MTQSTFPAPVPDMTEAARLADCETFALRERWAANQARYFARRDQEKTR